MDLTRALRTAQAAYDQADADLKTARAAFDAAARRYDTVRRYDPVGPDTEQARQAWGLAGREWIQALYRRETAKDALAAERHTVDREAADALHLPTRRNPR
ncbi:hypothetical protein [Microbispora rosea]|uniref:hypothetical protein n=1 Tax=Microbispora rosea TaxID=58117 RepID=UPI0037B4FF8F